MKNCYNNCNVPLKYRDPDDNYSLGSYVRRQKINFAAGKLNKEKIEKLESIGFDFELEDTFEAGYEYEHNKSRKRNLDHEWLNKYEIVKEYLALHNGKLPSDSEKVIYKNVNILSWVYSQKRNYKKGTLSNKRLEMLRMLKIDNYTFESDTHWDRMYDAAVIFKRDNGIGAVPPEELIIDGGMLKSWLYREQCILDGLFKTERTPEQVSKLAKIGIVSQKHDYHDRVWNEKYSAVSSFVSKNKRLPKTTENRLLFKWVSDQRIKLANGKLTDDKADKLRSIGVSL